MNKTYNCFSPENYHVGKEQQDKFVINMLNHKKNGYFIELGSSNPIVHNNTNVLENEYGWKGIMVEMSTQDLKLYKQHRQNSIHIFKNATTIDYIKLFEHYKVPKNVDYLQIDLEVNNRSTLTVLEQFDKNIFNNYKFSCVTFEHDIYRDWSIYNTREKSREIFKRNGYILIFPDIMTPSGQKFEDWYIYPEFFDTNLINEIKTDKSLHHFDVINIIIKAHNK